MMADPYFNSGTAAKESPEVALGRKIYHEALSDRRGFRPDQIGIPEDDDIWLEIFADIGGVAILEIAAGR